MGDPRHPMSCVKQIRVCWLQGPIQTSAGRLSTTSPKSKSWHCHEGLRVLFCHPPSTRGSGVQGCSVWGHDWSQRTELFMVGIVFQKENFYCLGSLSTLKNVKCPTMTKTTVPVPRRALRYSPRRHSSRPSSLEPKEEPHVASKRLI